MEKRILLSSPTMHEEEQQYINEAFEKNWIAPLGFNCDEFEKMLGEYTSTKAKRNKALVLSSCTAAIHMAVKLADVKQGDIVLCSDMTFVASVNPVLYEGATPVFIDSERETWNMDPKALEKALKKYPNAKAVILVHLYGTPAKMDEIIEICDKYNVTLIEDAAEALSATYKGEPCGSFGKYSALSFNGNKIITTSSGGAIISNNNDAIKKALFFSTQAKEPEIWYQHKEIGYNYRMSNIVAGVGRGQMLHLEEHREIKKKIYNTYKRAFEGLPIKMNPFLSESEPNFWLSCITIDKSSNVKWQDIYNALNDANIDSRPLWKPMHMQPLFSNNDFITVDDKPVNEDLFSRGLCLPSDIKMTDEEQQCVIDVVKFCF